MSRVNSGLARAASMTPEQRSAIAKHAASVKVENSKLPTATHDSGAHPLRIGGTELACYVLDDGRRMFSQRGLQMSLGMSSGGGKDGEQRLAAFALSIAEKANENNDLAARAKKLADDLQNPIKFKVQRGPANGYEATILADLCDLVLAARVGNHLHPQQEHIAAQAEILVRGFARIGIIALVDEATGYQRDRKKDALVKVLEAFVAKELQPYLSTFPADYYEQLFRIYNMPYPMQGNTTWRPSFFGHITNDVVYSRLAPELLADLKKTASQAKRKAKLHQWLTQDKGHPKLREHLASVVAILKLSNTPEQFKENVNVIHPKITQETAEELAKQLL